MTSNSSSQISIVIHITMHAQECLNRVGTIAGQGNFNFTDNSRIVDEFEWWDVSLEKDIQFWC